MAKCAQGDATGFRFWPLLSAAALRRKLLEVLTCGGGGVSSCRSRNAFHSPQPMPRPKPRSDRLAELLKAETSESGSDEAEAEAAVKQKKVEAFEALRRVVRGLQDGNDNAGGDRRREAASGVRQLAKDDPEARETLAMLGAIPALVAILDTGDGTSDLQIAALYALLNLGIGNDMNKAATVQAGAVHKMLRIVGESAKCSAPVSEAVVANFLSLSALDANKPIIGASGAIPFLMHAFQDTTSNSVQSQYDALRALFNLSIEAANAPYLVATGLVPALLAAVGDMSITDRALATLANLVAAAPDGRRAVSRAADAFSVLVDVLNWADAPECQEKAAYILMVMAHKSYCDRAAMAEAGINSALLELTLIGTALAQKRASRILEILRVGKGKQVAERPCDGNVGCSGAAAVSAPLEKGGTGEERDDVGMSEEKKAVRQLVQQSLQSNMRRIVRRARLPQNLAPSTTETFKALPASSTSKSLPF